jgi:hypothetical protein
VRKEGSIPHGFATAASAVADHAAIYGGLGYVEFVSENSLWKEKFQA